MAKGRKSVQEINRRANLELLIDEYGSAVALAKKLGYSNQSSISHFLGDPGMGEKAARTIERKLKLPQGYMDADPQRKPTLPNIEWLVAINLVLYTDPHAIKLSPAKQGEIVERAYENALRVGRVDPNEVKKLLALAK